MFCGSLSNEQPQKDKADQAPPSQSCAIPTSPSRRLHPVVVLQCPCSLQVASSRLQKHPLEVVPTTPAPTVIDWASSSKEAKRSFKRLTAGGLNWAMLPQSGILADIANGRMK